MFQQNIVIFISTTSLVISKGTNYEPTGVGAALVGEHVTCFKNVLDGQGEMQSSCATCTGMPARSIVVTRRTGMTDMGKRKRFFALDSNGGVEAR